MTRHRQRCRADARQAFTRRDTRSMPTSRRSAARRRARRCRGSSACRLRSLRAGQRAVRVGVDATRRRRCRRRTRGGADGLERFAPGQQRAEAGGIAEKLVERQRREVGRAVAETERCDSARRRRCRAARRSRATSRAATSDKRMAHAGEVRLRGKGHQAARVGELPRQRPLGIAQAQLLIERQISHRCAGAAGVLADAVHGIVVVDREDAARAGANG